MFTLFEMGTYAFFILMFVWLIVIGLLVEKDSDISWWWTLVWTGVVSVLYFYFGGKESVKSAFALACANPVTIIVGALTYVAIGAIWSFLKWIRIVAKSRDEVIKDVKGYKNFDPKILTSLMPKATDYKNSLVNYMLYWPISMVVTAVGRFPRYVFEWVYKKTAASFDAMSKKIFFNGELTEIINAKEKEKATSDNQLNKGKQG